VKVCAFHAKQRIALQPAQSSVAASIFKEQIAIRPGEEDQAPSYSPRCCAGDAPETQQSLGRAGMFNNDVPHLGTFAAARKARHRRTVLKTA